MLGGIRTLFRGGLSPQQTVQLAKLQLECASRAVDASVAMELCENAESALKKSAKRARQTSDVKEIGAVYKDIGKLQDRLGHHDKALANYKLAEKFEFTANAKSEQSPQIQETSSVQDLYPGERHFAKARSVFKFQPPGQGEKFDSTHQLAICLFLLQADPSPDEILDLATQQWLELIQNDTDGQEELHAMATEAIRVFARDETKDPKAITEVIYLAPVISADNFRYLLRQFYMEIDRSESSDLYNLEGLAQLIKGAGPGYLYADDLVKFLMLFSKCAGRLQQHSQSALRVRQFAVIISHVLDALADASIRGIDRQTLHEPFEGYLDSLKMSSDPFLVYQAVYAYQALLNLPDEETLWQAFSGRRRWIQGVSGILSPVKEYDFDGFINGLKDIQEGLSGVVLGGFTSPRSGESRDFVEGLREGLGFQRKCSWYPALRMTHVLLQDGQFSKFQTFVYEAPCRLDPAFQWGVCQQLGELAANPTWDANARQGAIAFLGGIYRDERLWGRHMSIKRWILGILVQLAASTGSDQKCK
ncbi:hypothetical protein BGX31_007489 [Mortierella sp. GBA43]|nr:hypothetical protein BGX31_007489 [Mortierella sp. GBA43]